MLQENVKDFLSLLRLRPSPAQSGYILSRVNHMVWRLAVKGSHATCSVREDFSAFFLLQVTGKEVIPRQTANLHVSGCDSSVEGW